MLYNIIYTINSTVSFAIIIISIVNGILLTYQIALERMQRVYPVSRISFCFLIRRYVTIVPLKISSTTDLTCNSILFGFIPTKIYFCILLSLACTYVHHNCIVVYMHIIHAICIQQFLAVAGEVRDVSRCCYLKFILYY